MVDFACWLHVEYTHGIALIRFPQTDMSEAVASEIWRELSQLAEEPDCHQFVLDLSMACCLNSSMLGKLIAFHKKVKQLHGELTLCSLHPEVADRFESMHLNKLFHICSTEEEALGEVPAGIA